MNKDILSITLSVSSLLIALLSLFISHKSFVRDSHKLIFEPYYIFEDYQGGEGGDYENICLIVRNIGRRVATIKRVGLYIGENNYNLSYNNIPKLLPGGYTSKYFLELLTIKPVEISENEEVILNFNSNEATFTYIKDYLRKHNQKGLIAVLDSRGKTHYIPIKPSMKFGYSI